MDYEKHQKGYEFKATYSHLNHSGLLFIRNETDGSLVRELPFPCQFEKITEEEVQKAINGFFEQIEER
ncbi:hypothetical protein JOD43_004437 [Pullulanibacillus pueri]|uniref:Uncharacterized protein n=1 Tax=Pullulanibacillus pueri TaxID=1437324 RepID=A0A8J2ZZY2_9BACL|nr:hypothetical protein [Pullulanibacillus pueri]MBM7684215.1 hypothetical protein [Pullulanibacillus pueri]GGH88986.1 hypothetical protein GCM10007096_42560 [Pullulanibacillus pueri]